MKKTISEVRMLVKSLLEASHEAYEEIDYEHAKKLAPRAIEALPHQLVDPQFEYDDDYNFVEKPPEDMKFLLDKSTGSLLLKTARGEFEWDGTGWSHEAGSGDDSSEDVHTTKDFTGRDKRRDLKKQVVRGWKHMAHGKDVPAWDTAGQLKHFKKGSAILAPKEVSSLEAEEMFPRAFEDFHDEFGPSDGISWKIMPGYPGEAQVRSIYGYDEVHDTEYHYEDGKWSMHEITANDYMDNLRLVHAMGGDAKKAYEDLPEKHRSMVDAYMDDEFEKKQDPAKKGN